MNRRTFLYSAGAVALSATRAQAARLPIRKGVYYSMLPKELSHADKFKLAKECGFCSIEVPTIRQQTEADEIKRASEASGIPVHSIMNSDHWSMPFSSPKPEVIEKGLECMRTSLQNAKFFGADSVLLVPGVVNAEVGYPDAWKRSQQAVRQLLPLAEKLKVVIGIEDVWNKFLLSPLEMARYVDEFKSPWVKAYFDVGNIVFYGFPQDWIRVLGKRICKLHLKDFAFRKNTTQFTDLREGAIDWKAVHAALTEIGYQGDATVELRGGDAAYLKEVSRRVDLILEGA